MNNYRIRWTVGMTDHSEAGKVRHFKTEQGESYGFSYKGKIHLDLRKIDAELPCRIPIAQIIETLVVKSNRTIYKYL